MGCKKAELKENINDGANGIVTDRDPTAVDTARIAIINMFNQYDALPNTQKNADWFYQQLPAGSVDIQTWQSWKRMARDVANIYGDDHNLSRVFDYFQQKQGMSASLRQFVVDFSAKANNLIANGTTPTAISSLSTQNNLQLRSLYGTSLSNEEINTRILFVESYSILYAAFAAREISGIIGGLTGEAGDRGCSWEGLATAVTISAITAVIFAKKLDAFFQDSDHSKIGRAAFIVTFSLIGGIATVGSVIGMAVWSVACGVSALLNWIFPGLGAADCTIPNDFFVYYTTCGSYQVLLLNGGSDINSTTWTPILNTGLTGTTTTFGSSAFSSPLITPPNPTIPSAISPSSHTCQTTVTSTLSCVFTGTTIDNAVPPAVAFAVAPTTVSYNTEVQYWVTTSSSYSYQNLSWAFPDGGASIVAQGDYWIKVRFWLAGTRRVRATLTNTCSGISGSTDVSVQVNQ